MSEMRTGETSATQQSSLHVAGWRRMEHNVEKYVEVILWNENRNMAAVCHFL